jgi:hypothetical protein
MLIMLMYDGHGCGGLKSHHKKSSSLSSHRDPDNNGSPKNLLQ